MTALKIHVSPKTKEILDTFGTFELVCRGEVILKVSPHICDKRIFLDLTKRRTRRYPVPRLTTLRDLAASCFCNRDRTHRVRLSRWSLLSSGRHGARRTTRATGDEAYSFRLPWLAFPGGEKDVRYDYCERAPVTSSPRDIKRANFLLGRPRGRAILGES